MNAVLAVSIQKKNLRIAIHEALYRAFCGRNGGCPPRGGTPQTDHRFGFKCLYPGKFDCLIMSITKWFTVLPAVVCCLRGGDLEAASRPSPPYGQQVVAAVLMGEAWGEGEAAMTAVAEVIRRRADLKGISPLAVVVQPKQFTCLNRCSPEDLIRRFHNEPDFQKALRIARRLYNQPRSLPGHSRGATHFERVGNRAHWTRGHQPVARVGQLAFYRILE